MGTIGDMLNNVPEPEAVTEEVPEVIEAQPETVERPRGPDGKFISKETGVEPVAEAIAEPVPPTEQTNQLPRDVYEPLKAIRGEIQELKAQLAAIQQQLAQSPAQPQQPPVDFWDDPQAFMSTEMSRFGDQLLQQWERRQHVQRLETSEQAAKAKYADYPEAFSAFEQAVQLNPRMAHEMAQAPDPGEFAYRKGKTALEIQRVGSVDELRAEIRAELQAEARAVIQPKLPSTTAADGSVGARGGPEWGGPATLTQMLG